MSWHRLISLKSCVLFLAYTFVLSGCGPNAVGTQPTKSLTLDSQGEGLNAALAPLRDEAMQLQQRLASLEALIAKQDARHQEVEGMIASALDHTTDQLEAFLRQVGADPSTFGSTENAQAEVAAKSALAQAVQQPVPVGTRPSSPKEVSGSDQGRSISPVPDTLQTSTNASKGNEPKGSTRFMWWSLAGLAVVGGFVLLRRQQHANPLAVAPEMQVRTPPARRSRKQQAHPQSAADEPEVEDLWATAALLGEAIGRLKDVEDSDHPDGGVNTNTAGTDGLQDRGNGAPNQGKGTADSIGIENDDKLPFVAPPNGAPPGSPSTALDNPNTLPKDRDVAQLLGLPASTKPKEDPPPTEPPPMTTVPSSGPLAANEHGGPRQPAASSPSMCKPITCRLPVTATLQIAGRVRSLLDADPRVLRSPAPRVRKLHGHLEVSFSVLPGLPDGERSLLEQQLRDTVT